MEQQLVKEIVQKPKILVTVDVLLVILRACMLLVTHNVRAYRTVARNRNSTNFAEHRLAQLLLHAPLHILFRPRGLLALQQSAANALPVHRVASNVLQLPFQLVQNADIANRLLSLTGKKGETPIGESPRKVGGQ